MESTVADLTTRVQSFEQDMAMKPSQPPKATQDAQQVELMAASIWKVMHEMKTPQKKRFLFIESFPDSRTKRKTNEKELESIHKSVTTFETRRLIFRHPSPR